MIRLYTIIIKQVCYKGVRIYTHLCTYVCMYVRMSEYVHRKNLRYITAVVLGAIFPQSTHSGLLARAQC